MNDAKTVAALEQALTLLQRLVREKGCAASGFVPHGVRKPDATETLDELLERERGQQRGAA
jgi:hypothetical protein